MSTVYFPLEVDCRLTVCFSFEVELLVSAIRAIKLPKSVSNPDSWLLIWSAKSTEFRVKLHRPHELLTASG
jgi:hypothetical protein